MPIVQIDWDEIKNSFGDVTAIYAFTHRQASLLLSLAEQLSWDKTFRDFGYDFTDRDALEWEIDDLRNNLMSPVNLEDFVPLIDDVESLLREIATHAGCCDATDITDGVQYTDEVVDGVGDVPQNIIDAGYASGTTDWTGFDDYKCLISHIMVQSMEETLRQLLPHVDSTGSIIGGIGTVAAALGALLASGGTSIVLSMIAAVGAAATVWRGIAALLDTGLESLADDVALYHHDLACAIYNSDGSEDALDSLYAEIDNLFSGTDALVLKNLNIGPRLRALYAGRYNQQDAAQALADNGLDPADFDCECDNSQFTYLFPVDTEGIVATSNLTLTWVSSGLVTWRADNTSAYGEAGSEDSEDIATRFGLSTPIIASSLEIKLRCMDDGLGSGPNGERDNRLRIRVFLENHSYEEIEYSALGSLTGSADMVREQWYTKTFTFSSPIQLDSDQNSLGFSHRRTATPAEILIEVEYIKVY